MKRTLQLLAFVISVIVLGCKRESRSPHESDAVPLNPKVEAGKKTSPGAVGQVALSTEWDRSRAVQMRQYEKMEAFAKDVSTVCGGTNGEEAVDALLAKVSDLIDEFKRGIEGEGNAMGYRTAFVSPFVREIESHWAKRWLELAKTPPEDVLREIQHFCRLSAKVVDLLRNKVGNSFDTTSLELNICTSLKWVSHHFERVGWEEQKKEVNRMLEDWKENRYDVLEGNPLKDACEHVEFYASKDPNREKRHAAVYSRTKNMYVDKALHIVGRLPKWFAAWAEEMERKDAAARSQSKNEDRAHGSSREHGKKGTCVED